MPAPARKFRDFNYYEEHILKSYNTFEQILSAAKAQVEFYKQYPSGNKLAKSEAIVKKLIANKEAGKYDGIALPSG